MGTVIGQERTLSDKSVKVRDAKAVHVTAEKGHIHKYVTPAVADGAGRTGLFYLRVLSKSPGVKRYKLELTTEV
jgi:hypothetical protein